MQPLNSRLGRRDFLKLATLAGVGWMTPVGQMLARAAEQGDKHEPARSIILLWMQGGPSQLETFDPHPGREIAGGTKALDTAVKGVQLAEHYPRLAEQMADVSLVRSVTSKEGDHERGTYNLKTGYRPDPTAVHPSYGAVFCHATEDRDGKAVEIPRHISILPSQWPARGGFLGDQFDAFKTGDPINKVPDVTARVPEKRDNDRLRDLDFLEKRFAKGRSQLVDDTGLKAVLDSARRMMSSEQLKAFDVTQEPKAVRDLYGDSPFGRGCLAARRLIEVGVRCVEVELNGWDTHAKNHSECAKQAAILDPAFAALLRELRERKLLDKTLVICAGEFGRTPKINPAGGRDHWPNGFTVALAGGGIKGGRVIGETDPDGGEKPKDSVTVSDVHATILTAVGLDITKKMATTIGRTLTLSEGTPIEGLMG
jgi:hypothetical protein